MGTDSKTAIQQPTSKVAVVSSSKNIKKKKSKTSHHKTKHGKQQRSDSSSSQSSNDNDRTVASSSSKKSNTGKTSKEKSKSSSTNETRHGTRKSSTSKKRSARSKHDSSESPPRRNNNPSARSRSRSRSHSGRSSDRSSSRESPSRYRQKNPPRRSGSNMQNVYSPMSHSNFPPNMGRRYPPPNAVHGRGGRMLPYIPPPMMGGPPMRNNNGLRRSGGGGGGGNNSPPQSLLGGYRPPGGGNFRGRGGPMNNPAYMHNMANMINLLQQQQMQQQQKPGSHKYANPNNPNNRFYQQFQDNYKKISSGQKISNLYQASFPVQHIPREMRFNFRLLGRNIFTASDEEEEEKQKQQQQQQQQQQSGGSSEKRPKQRRETSSESESQSEDDRRRRHDADDDDEDDEKTTTSKSKSKLSPTGKNSNEQKRSSTKNNRNRTSSSNATSHPKTTPAQQEMLNNSTNLSTLLAGIMQSDNPEVLANSLVTAAAAVNSKRERNKKQQEKKVQKFKNYARFQQIQASAAGVTPQTNPDEVEKKIHGLARRLQMKTIGLHDDYESQGMKRSDESSIDSDTGERRHRSSGSSSERSKDKEGGSDASNNSQRQRKLKKGAKRTGKKTNAAGQLIGSSDSEQHRSDGNDSDGSMLNLNEDLKPIGYYVKDRERMLQEMFRCVRGHKLQAILPDGLKTRSFDEIKAKCLDQLDILSKKRIRAIIHAQPMTSSSGTEDSTDEDDHDFFTLYPHLNSSLDISTSNGTNVANPAALTPTPSAEDQKKSLQKSKFRPVSMQAVSDAGPAFQNNLSAPVVVGAEEDVNDYYEGFKHIRKLTNLRRNEQEDDFLPFPEQSGKLFQPIGSTFPKFEFKPITGLTHSQQAHLKARRAANRQHLQEKQSDVRQEIDDLLNIEDFVLPDGERPLSSAELSLVEQRRYGLPPRLHHRQPPGPPKKGSLGHLLKEKNKTTGDRSPSPSLEETNSRQGRRRRQRSHSLSSTGSGQWSRSSSPSNKDDRTSRHSSRESAAIVGNNANGVDQTANFGTEDITDMNDLSKLLDLNEEDELLLLQIEVEQEERNIRREEKRRRKDEKKTKKSSKKVKLASPKDEHRIVEQCLREILNQVLLQEDSRTQTKRTFDHNDSLNTSSDELTKKFKIEETN